jgi:PAS domain S-box-containing protein
MTITRALEILGARRLTRQRVAWSGALFIAAMVAIAAFDMVRGYRAAVDDTGRELETQARITAEQTARSVHAVDIVLRHVAAEFRRGRLSQLSPEDLHAYLREQSVGLVQIDGFAMHDARGDALAISWLAPRAAASVAAMPAFTALRDGPGNGLLVSAAVRSPTDQQWVFPIGRRLETPAGDFAGVIGARGRIAYFEQFYRDVQLDPGTRVTLMHTDGSLLARHPPAPAALGQHFALFDSMRAAQARGGRERPLRIVSPIDGVERFGTVRSVPDYPLAVIVTRDVAQALAPWRVQAIGTAVLTLALGLLAALLLAMVMGQLTRLVAARESLEASKERFALAVAGSDDGVWDWDYKAGMAFESARARELQGLPPGPELQPIEDLVKSLRVHPEDAPRRAEGIRAHLAGETPAYECEYRVLHDDGVYRWVRIRAMCIRDADGKPVRMAGSVSDIDARKRAEEALRLSEERYAIAMTGSDEAHWVWNVKTDELYASPQLRRLTGVADDAKLVRRNEWMAALPIHPDDAPLLQRAVDDHRAGRTPRLDLEYRVVDRDTQAVRWLHTRGQCFRDAQGAPERMAGSTVEITQRKRAEEALRESEAQKALAVAGSNDGILYWDIVHDQMYSSPRAMQIAGIQSDRSTRPRAEWLALMKLHPDDVQRHADDVRANLEGEVKVREAEYRLLHPDGQYRWVHVRGIVMRDENGRPVRWGGSISDIDARKRAEQALRESEQRYQLAVEGANDGILDWDIVADRMFASERAMRLLGLQPDSVVRTRAQWAELVMPRFHPDDAQRLRDELHGTVDNPADTHEGEYRALGSDGVYRWLRFRGRTVRDANGRAMRWAGSVSDVDALKKAEQALRESEQRYQLAVAGSNQGLWDWDLSTDTVFFSARAQQLIGDKPGEALRPRREWLERWSCHPEDMPRVRQALADYLHGTARLWEVEYRLRHGDGQWHWYRDRGVALRDESGRPYRMAGSLEDITDRKLAQAQREQLEGQLRQAQKLEAIGTLAGGIAHDFNNILAAILGYGEMAQRDAAEGTSLRRHIDATLSAAMRAKSLVERILAFSRSGMGERVPVHVQSVVEEALEQIAASLPPGIALQRELAAGNAAVFGDPTQVHQVVLNLCANAVQAMPQGGTLSVSVHNVHLAEARVVTTSRLEAGAYIRLVVGDSGVGIAPRVLERIFDPFFTTKEIGVGTGLGLSLVHGIVADLGGGIDVQSQLGSGTTLTVYLPWSSCAAPAVAVEQPVTQGAGETVLLVDDERALVALGEEMMAQLGYEPVGFASSTAALESLRATPARFDLVLTDEAMPEMTGSELAREIRKIRPDIPIVLMSGYVTPALIARARELGIAEVLPKPLVQGDIARGLASALQRSTAA